MDCSVLQPLPKFFIAAFLVASASFAYAKADIDPARVREIAKMLASHATGPGVNGNRPDWNKLAAEPVFQEWLGRTREQLAQPIPETSDELFLDYSRTGNRTRWQQVASLRRERLSDLALAECLENKGAFLPELEAAIKSICAEKTWVYPAHDRKLRNFKGEVVGIDLGSSRVAAELAAIHCFLGDNLSRPTRSLIRENLERRIFKSYRDMVEGRIEENSWLRATHNWNSVCHSGVVGAALAAFDSPEDRAWFIAAAEFYLPHFLSGFGTDGYCSEGVSYWGYGFGHFVMLSESVRQVTDGKIDFMAHPQARLAALFGKRAEILNGIYLSIADCRPGTQPDRQISAYIFERFELADAGRKDFFDPEDGLSRTALFSFLPEKLPPLPKSSSVVNSPLRSWFPEGGVLICRPQRNGIPFAVSLKGGHNDEHHNHNDLGSFIVVAGNSMVLADPGSEVYTARTFGDGRYKSDVLNSFGHNVPVVAGKLQSSGAKARAVILKSNFTETEDNLSLDLASAYAVPNLTKLHRHFTYRRSASPSLVVRDHVEFTTAQSFETALVTWGKCEKLSDSEFLFTEKTGGVRVKFDTAGIPLEMTSKQLEADVVTSQKPVRFGFRLQEAVTNATVTMTITPIPGT